MESDHSQIIWISASVLTILVFLLLPVEAYDAAFVLLILGGAALTGFLLAKVVKSITGETKWKKYIIVLVVLLLLANVKSYQFRRTNLLDKYGEVTDGKITYRSTSRGKSQSSHFLHYTYHTADGMYSSTHQVSFEVYLNVEIGPDIQVDYVPHRPSVSRISRSSLVPDPDAQKKFLEWQQQNRAQ